MRKLLTLSAFILAASALSAQTTVYSTTDFSGWLRGTNPTFTGGDLVTTASTTNAAFGYFEASGSPYNMTTGETLTLTTNFTLSGNAVASSQNVYFTLQNSNGNQLTTNLAGATANAAFANYQGYAVMINPAPANASAGRFNVRTGTNSNIVGSTGAWAQATTNTGGTFASTSYVLTSGSTYQMVLSIKDVSATEIDFSYSLLNTTTSSTLFSATGLIGSNIVTAFDTIAIGVVGTQNVSYTFKDVSLVSSLSSPVPEPATYAAGAALLALAFAGWRRYRRPAAV